MSVETEAYEAAQKKENPEAEHWQHLWEKAANNILRLQDELTEANDQLGKARKESHELACKANRLAHYLEQVHRENPDAPTC